MTQALITVNAVAGSNTDLPIGVLVSLNNTGNGGEVSFSWTILDQPPGTADALSSGTVQNPTFTPKKEGSYLIQLVVNASLADEQTNRVVCAIRQLKTRLRVPAAGEVAEADAADGWAAHTNENLRLIDTIRADPGIMVAQLGYTADLNDVVYFSGVATLKSTLPGQEIVPVVSKADSSPATPTDFATAEMGMVIGVVAGVLLTSGKLAYVRLFGLVTGVAVLGTPVDEAVVYLSTISGVLSTTVSARRLGRIVDVASAYSVFFNGLAAT